MWHNPVSPDHHGEVGALSRVIPPQHPNITGEQDYLILITRSWGKRVWWNSVTLFISCWEPFVSNWNQQMLKHGRQTVSDGESALEYLIMFSPSVINHDVLISPADVILSVFLCLWCLKAPSQCNPVLILITPYSPRHKAARVGRAAAAPERCFEADAPGHRPVPGYYCPLY